MKDNVVYTIGVDISDKDESVLVVVKRDGLKLTTVATYYGKEAEDKYQEFLDRFANPIHI